MPVFVADVSTTGSVGFSTGNSILQGNVVPNGAPTEVWFQWGTDPTLQVNDTTPHQIVSGLQPIGFAAIIGPLLPGTTYYYRAVSRNEAGTTFGQILSFTTPSTIVLPGVPTVTTGSANGITKSSTTLSGSVTPNGAAATAWFEWGTTPTLGTSFATPTQIIGSGTVAVPFNAPLGSLSSNTTYWFRLAAANAGGTSRGAISSFTTLADPALTAPGASTSAATVVATTTATLNGTAAPNGVPTLTWFEYATNPSLTGAAATPTLPIGSGTSAVPLGTAISGLAPGTTYWFRTVAMSAGGTSRGAILSFTTTASPSGSPPTAVTGAATLVTKGSAQLGGGANPHGQATNGWIEYGTDPLLGAFTATSPQALGAGTTTASYTASPTGLAANTTYWFRAAASNADGTGRGAIASFRTLPDAAVTPPLATTTVATFVGPASATLNGTGNPNGAQATAWFEWSSSPLLTSPTVTASQSIGSGGGAVSASIPLVGLTPGTTYYYRIVVANAGGTSTGAIVPFTTTTTPVVGAPIVTTAAPTSVTFTSATLNGTANPNGSATMVWFEWGTDATLASSSSTTAQAIGSGTSALAFPADLAGLSPEVRYYFRIVASNASGTTRGAILTFRAVP
jgi:phosphodiesterase/alkaline phosphatase D-like protein